MDLPTDHPAILPDHCQADDHHVRVVSAEDQVAATDSVYFEEQIWDYQQVYILIKWRRLEEQGLPLVRIFEFLLIHTQTDRHTDI